MRYGPLGGGGGGGDVVGIPERIQNPIMPQPAGPVTASALCEAMIAAL